MALEGLVAVESGLEEFYQLRRPLFQGDVSQQTCIAIVVMKRIGGLLVAVPLDFFGAEDKVNMNMLGEACAVGSRTSLTVPAEREKEGGGREPVEDIDVLVFDLDASMAGHLTAVSSVTEEAQDLMMCFVEEDASIAPEPDGLLRLVREWVEVQAADSTNLGFYSAVEAQEEEEVVPETPKPGRRKEPKDPTTPKPKRVTTALLAEQLQGLMDAIPKLSEQVVEMQEAQAKMREEMLVKVSAPPPRPSQMPISAGLPMAPAISGVAQMLGSPPRVKPGPSLPLGLPATAKSTVLRKGLDSQLNTQEQAEEIEEPGSVLATAVLEQSRALTSLVSHLQQGSDPLLGGPADSSGLSLSSKGAAQREKLQLQLASRSGGFCLAVLQNAVRKLKPAARLPMSLEEAADGDFSLCTYLERYGGYGACKELGLVQYAVAHIFDAAVRGDLAGTQELTALLAVGLEQASMDGGRMEFGYRMMLLEEPPSNLWSYRQASYDPRSRAFSPLAPQRWATCALAFSKEIDYIQSKRQEIAAKKAAPVPLQPSPKKKKFPKAKAQGQQEEG